jgi:hypothetical protein
VAVTHYGDRLLSAGYFVWDNAFWKYTGTPGREFRRLRPYLDKGGHEKINVTLSGGKHTTATWWMLCAQYQITALYN